MNIIKESENRISIQNCATDFPTLYGIFSMLVRESILHPLSLGQELGIYPPPHQFKVHNRKTGHSSLTIGSKTKVRV